MCKQMRQIMEKAPEDKISLAESQLAGTPAIMNCHERCVSTQAIPGLGKSDSQNREFGSPDENGSHFLTAPGLFLAAR